MTARPRAEGAVFAMTRSFSNPDPRTDLAQSCAVRSDTGRPKQPEGTFKAIATSVGLTLISFAVCLVMGEAVLRIKNSSMKNYDIEMWRYAKELKQLSPDQNLGFDHVRSRSALLQGVEIRINEAGLRGGPLEPVQAGGRRILFLGGSITLGWGVSESETTEAQLEDLLRRSGTHDQVLNGGVGNYNTARYVSRYFKELTDLQPTDIVVQYFLRDAEALAPEQGNIILRNSQLAVTLWTAYHRLFDRSGETALLEHYQQAYRQDAQGFLVMREMLRKLADHAKSRNIRIYLAMVPDIHNLIDYKLGFIHATMQKIATEDGYAYVDLLPALQGRSPEELFAMPGDPHPNALGHKLMAEAAFRLIGNTHEGAEN
jgi:lysophospholipase L1-like esterase